MGEKTFMHISLIYDLYRKWQEALGEKYIVGGREKGLREVINQKAVLAGAMRPAKLPVNQLDKKDGSSI